MPIAIAAPHRKLKRVPLDFDWPLDEIWPGYYDQNPLCHIFHRFYDDDDEKLICDKCTYFCELAKIPFVCEKEYQKIEPPTGEGYQMWETTSEGSPQTPVFKTLDELLRYCAGNCTIFGEEGGTIEDWSKVLIDTEGTELFKDK